MDEHLVRRVRNTIPQKELNESQRHRNLKNAFQLTADIVEYKRVVLVDDIYTTGSTMDEVSKVLKASGVENIYYICIRQFAAAFLDEINNIAKISKIKRILSVNCTEDAFFELLIFKVLL